MVGDALLHLDIRFGHEMLICPHNSGQGGVKTQEAIRTLARADPGTDRNPRSANKCHRIGQHQQGDPPGYGEGGRGDETNPWQAHAREG